MTALNAFLFAFLGTAMGILPRAFPAWFPHFSDAAFNSRAIWLEIVGAVQVSIGIGYLFWFMVVPGLARLAVSHANVAVPLADPSAAGR